MSVIQNIRTRYAKVAGFVIALALVGFILMDAVSGSLGSLFGRDESVARVEGKKISQQEFSKRTADLELLSTFFQPDQKIDEAARAGLRAEVLQQMVFEKLVEDEADALGIRITDAEKSGMLRGPNAHPAVQQFFVKVFGADAYDPRMVDEFEKQVPKNTPEGQKVWELWDALKDYLVVAQRAAKFNAMIAGSVYTPAFMADAQTADAGRTASVRYVKVPYTSVPDAEAKVSDDDLRKYMEKHAARFTVPEPTRQLEYVSFDVVPSAEDTAETLGALRALSGEFSTTPDIASFVNRNSDRRYDTTFFTKAGLPATVADTLLSAAVGTVIGPLYEEGGFQLLKVVERRTVPDSAAARHILIGSGAKFNRDDSTAHRIADSVAALIRAGANMDTLATALSDDEGSKLTAGDLGTFAYGAMVPEFNAAVFQGTPGDLRVVRTQFGYHVIRVGAQKGGSAAIRLAVLRKDFSASENTNTTAFAKATEFSGAASGKAQKAFEDAIKKESYTKRLAENVRAADFVIEGLGPAREIIRWAWEAKVGAVSSPFSVDGRHVVARLASQRDAGLVGLDASTRPQIEAAVRAEKKAEIIRKKYKGTQGLDAIAAASGVPVLQADSFSAANPFAPSIGFEPKVVGYSFYEGFKQGATSPGIGGADGVFYIQLIGRTAAPASSAPNPMAAQQKAMAEMQTRQSLGPALQETFRRGAKIKYTVKNL